MGPKPSNYRQFHEDVFIVDSLLSSLPRVLYKAVMKSEVENKTNTYQLKYENVKIQSWVNKIVDMLFVIMNEEIVVIWVFKKDVSNFFELRNIARLLNVAGCEPFTASTAWSEKEIVKAEKEEIRWCNRSPHIVEVEVDGHGSPPASNCRLETGGDWSLSVIVP